MTSVDELFKKPTLPSGSIKRKFEALDAQESYKAAKLESNDVNDGQHGARASIEDAPEDDDDVEAGPALPPDEEANDDEEGRFFGGGVSADAAEALDYVDQQDEGEDLQDDKIDSAWLKRLSTSFERKVTKNAELRAKFEGEPQKFMASEADLDAEIKSWSLMSDHPELYKAFVESGSAQRLVGLLAHDNTDIAIGAIEMIAELLEDETYESVRERRDLMKALLAADLVQLLMSNLERLNEEVESDRNGVYHIMTVLDALANDIFSEEVGRPEVLDWICHRIRRHEKVLGQNKEFAAQLLLTFAEHSGPKLYIRFLEEMDVIELLLQLLYPYRKRDPPRGTYEEEYATSLFKTLIQLVQDEEGRAKFVEAEGVELAVMMLQDGGFSKSRALHLLDNAMCGTESFMSLASTGSREVTIRFVRAAGLKPLFRLFMKRNDWTSMKFSTGIFSALLRELPGESAERIRLIGKFTENVFEKTSKLVKVRERYKQRLAAENAEIARIKEGMSEQEVADFHDEAFERRLDAGENILQMLDIELAWLVAEDAGAKETIVEEWPEKGRGLRVLKTSLADYVVGERGSTKEILDTLITFL